MDTIMLLVQASITESEIITLCIVLSNLISTGVNNNWLLEHKLLHKFLKMTLNINTVYTASEICAPGLKRTAM